MNVAYIERERERERENKSHSAGPRVKRHETQRDAEVSLSWVAFKIQESFNWHHMSIDSLRMGVLIPKLVSLEGVNTFASCADSDVVFLAEAKRLV